MGLNFRAERTTRNADDLRVLLAGSIIAILLMLTLPLANRWWDEYGAQRPFIRGTVEIVQTAGFPHQPELRYRAQATRAISAVWVASVYTETGVRFGSRRGNGNYSPEQAELKVWTWEAFFDNEAGAPPPTIPTVPFKVCVRYIATTTSGVEDETPDYCSNVFTPYP